MGDYHCDGYCCDSMAPSECECECHGSLLADRGGVCLCGAVGAWTLTFGGRGPARFTCNVCDRDYDVDGNPLTKPG